MGWNDKSLGDYKNDDDNNDDNNNNKYKRTMIGSRFCDYSDAYIRVKETITENYKL